MKKILLVIGIVAGWATMQSVDVTAQSQSTDKWSGSVEFDPVFSTTKGVDASFNLKMTATRKIYDYLSAGFGIGVGESFKFNTLPSIPVFARIQAEDFSREFSPFVRFDAGYAMNLDDFSNGGIVINPTVGVRYNGFTFGVGYHGFKSTQSGSKMSNSVNISVGYNFGYHKSNSALARYLRKVEFSLDMGATLPLGGKVCDEATETSSYSLKYKLGGDVNAALLFPVTKNFYAGIMSGIVLYRYKEEGSTKTYGYSNTEWTPSVPIALRLKYKFREISVADKFYPYAQLDLGIRRELNGVYADNPKYFYCAPSVGLSLDVYEGAHSVDLGLTYVPMNVKYYESGDWSWDGEEEKSFGALKISLGYTF